MDEWWHSTEGSSEDNHNKEKVIIYGEYNEEASKQEYDVHFRRYIAATVNPRLVSITIAWLCVELRMGVMKNAWSVSSSPRIIRS